MKHLSKIFVIFRIFGVLKDLKLYSDFLTIVKNESLNSPQWSRLKLRRDWIGRIYTVVNLPPEVTMSRDFPREARPAFVFEEIRPINEYLTKLNLHEIITPLLKPIPETNDDSFLIIYSFVFRELSWFWLIRFFIEIFLFIWLYNHLDQVTQILNLNAIG
jgi:hypothetical protein